MNLKLVIPFALYLALGAGISSYASVSGDGMSAQVSALSPTDSSLWIGTSADGIFRFGRNGRVLHYCVASGHLKNDAIQSLVFDGSGNLYILDGAGSLVRYSSVEGFAAVPSFESGVGSLSESAGTPYIIRDSLLYSLSSSAPMLVRVLPFNIASEPLPAFEYDAELKDAPSDSSPAEAEEKGVSLLPLLWIAVGLCLGILLGFVLFKKRKVVAVVEDKKPAEVKAAPVKRVPKLVKVEQPKEEEVKPTRQLSLEEALQASAFGRQVMELVVSHLDNPSYGVEEVAADIGLSRIHVNRKLKAETGYSPSAVFKFIRMDHVSKLLQEGKLSIAEVAKAGGFSSASYFSTAFKDYFNISPSEFVARQEGSSVL